jgi:hypothetical protein
MFGVGELDMHVRSQCYCSGLLLACSMRCTIFPFGRMIALSNSWLPGIRFDELITVLFLSLLCRWSILIPCRGGLLAMSNGGTGRFEFLSVKRRVVAAMGLFLRVRIG